MSYVTQILSQIEQGDFAQSEQLLPLVYGRSTPTIEFLPTGAYYIQLST